jgi:hypothetical protein
MGRIPKNTECPYKMECDPEGKFCRHLGLEHECDYSCAFARAYDISWRNEKNKKDKK